MPQLTVPPDIFFNTKIKETVDTLLQDDHWKNLLTSSVFMTDNEDEIYDDVYRINLLASLNLENAEVEHSMCRSCYDFNPLYIFSVIHKNDTVPRWYDDQYEITEYSEGYSLYKSINPMCVKCAQHRIVMKHLYLDDHIRRQFYSKILPPEAFPSPSVILDNCYTCNNAMIDSSVNTENFGYGYEPYTKVISTNDDGLEVYTHKKCSWKCNGCENYYVENHEHYVPYNRLNNRVYCISCFNPDDHDYSQCDSCETWVTNRIVYSDIRGDYRCLSCYEEYIECNECGYEYQEDDGHMCEEEDNGSHLVHEYSYKPRTVFFGDDRIYLGMELEVEASQRRLNLHEGAEYLLSFKDNVDRMYLKSDGSIQYGFEIVTHPHSLGAYHNLDWSWLNKLKTMGYRSWDVSTCGIHIHIGLTAFVNENHQIRFTKFIYDNERQVKRIAGRASSYASFNEKGKVIPKIKYKNQDSNRYSAVNVQNEHTLEVRVFKGSLRKERVLSAIEFVHAVAEYTRSLEIIPKLKPFSWARFVAYVSANSDIYPNLFIIINETFESDTTANDQENN